MDSVGENIVLFFLSRLQAPGVLFSFSGLNHAQQALKSLYSCFKSDSRCYSQFILIYYTGSGRNPWLNIILLRLMDKNPDSGIIFNNKVTLQETFYCPGSKNPGNKRLKQMR